MNKKVKISLIIVTYNSSDFIDRCLDSVYRQTYKDFEIVIVDNDSRDGLVDYVADKYKDVKVIASMENLGFAGGINLGIADSDGEFIAILNPDVILDDRWLESLITVAGNYPQAYIFSSLILNYHDHELIVNAGYKYSVFGTHFLIGYNERNVGQYNEVRPVFYGTGCALFFRRLLVEKIGYFDQDYFLYCEETDFCWLSLLAGFEILIVPSAIVFHYRQASTKELPAPFIYYLIRRNTVRMLLKYQNWSILWYALVVRFLIDFFMTLKIAKLEYFISMVKAYSWNLINLRKTLSKRRETKTKIKFRNRELIKKQLMLGIFRFFILMVNKDKL